MLHFSDIASNFGEENNMHTPSSELDQPKNFGVNDQEEECKVSNEQE